MYLCTFSYYGISRSASIITAYIMKKYKISFDDAFQRYVDKYLLRNDSI